MIYEYWCRNHRIFWKFGGRDELWKGPYCPYCGKPFEKFPLGVECPKCKAYHPYKRKFCSKCGAKLPKPEWRWNK